MKRTPTVLQVPRLTVDMAERIRREWDSAKLGPMAVMPDTWKVTRYLEPNRKPRVRRRYPA